MKRAQFIAGICREHAEEISFLRLRRRALLAEPFASLRALADTEERLAAHVEGVLAEPAPVEDICLELSQSDDPDDRYAALLVLGRRGLRHRFWEVFASTAWQDSEHEAAATDALLESVTPQWTPDVEAWLETSEGPQAAAIARAIGTRRLALGPMLLLCATRGDTPDETHLWALGRLAYPPARAVLESCLTGGTSRQRHAAALALLGGFRDRQLAGSLSALAVREPWAAIPAAIAGGDLAAPLSGLLEMSTPGLDVADVVLALGLTGSVAAVPRLLACLDEPELAEEAAVALHVMTGAELREEVVTLDEDLLEPDELTAVRDGTLDPRKVGTVSTRLAREPRAWHAWLTGNRAKLAAGRRYRFGLPFSGPVVAEGLATTAVPCHVRDWMALELEVRYGVPLQYWSTQPVGDQRRAIAAYAQIAPVQNSRPGSWDFER